MKRIDLDYSYLEQNAVPDQTVNNLKMYFENNYHPGGFLMSLIKGNYKEALGRADSFSISSFGVIAIWLLRNNLTEAN